MATSLYRATLKRALWVGAATLVLGIVVLVLAVLAPGPKKKCPQVFRIAGDSDPKTSFNVLFVSSGFSEKELDAYRNAAIGLVGLILKEEPFCEYRSAMNFYRMDLVGAPVTTNSKNCSTLCTTKSLVSPGLPPPPLATLNPSGDATRKADPECAFCNGDGSHSFGCQLLAPSKKGMKRTLNLATGCAPNISQVIILVNSNQSAGSGQVVNFQGSIGVTAIGVPSDDKGNLSDWAGYLATHEMGHALGLLDEYGYPLMDALEDVPSGRNVWKPVDSCWDPSAPVKPNIPWKKLLGCPEFLDPMKCSENGATPVCSDAKLTPKPWQPVHVYKTCEKDPATGAPKDCRTSCSTPSPVSDCPCWTGPIPECQSLPGLYEGAFYRPTGYYRAQMFCRMKEKDYGFCGACQKRLRKVLGGYGAPGPCG